MCRYATPGGFRESALAAGLRGEDLQNEDMQKQARHRMYTPGGPMARELAKNPTVLIVNDTLFAHGGVLKRHGKQFDMQGPGLLRDVGLCQYHAARWLEFFWL